jgi:hypothetical protein
LWKIIQEKSPIWYFGFDQTIAQDLDTQKKAAFFSMVCNDKRKNKCIPVFDFIAELNSKEQLVKYFNLALSNLSKHFTKENTEENLKKFKIAPIIVTFFSSVSIDSLMFTFNSMQIDNYLTWSFNILKNDNPISENTNMVNTCIYVSAKSFMNYFIHNLREVNHLNVNNKVLAVYCISLLQNCISFDLAGITLIHIQNIFLSRYKTSRVINSYNFIINQAKVQKLDRINYNDLLLDKIHYDKNQFNHKFEYIFFEEKLHFPNSPFEKYFRKLLKSSELNLNIQKNSQNNDHFCSEIFDLILENLSTLPFWSALLLNHFQIKFSSIFSQIPFSHLTNEPVRTYLSILKNHLLKNKSFDTSSIVSALYPEIKRIYNKHYLFNQDKMYDQEYFEERKNDTEKTKQNKRSLEEDENVEIWVGSGSFKKKKEFSYYGSEFSKNDFTIDNKHESNDEIYFFKEPIKKLENFSNVQIKHQERSFTKKLKEKYESLKIRDICYQSSILKTKLHNLNIKKIAEIFLSVENSQSIEIIKKKLENETPFLDGCVYFVRELKQILLNDFQSCYDLYKKSFTDSPFVPISSNADGNCLYNSFSLLFSGSEENFFIFKLLSIYILFKYSNSFKNILSDMDIDSFIVKSLRKDEWGMDLNILSLAALVERPVHTYLMNENKKINLITIHSTQEYSDHYVKSIPVIICFCYLDNNVKLGHFFPLFIKNKQIDTNTISTFERVFPVTYFPDEKSRFNLNNNNNNNNNKD